jgi:BirA family biotin operon repressor/biotin-[acetyl-CoA-carboxylase] ligase
MTVHWRFEIVDQTASTNTDLINRWHGHDLNEPIALLALSQTAGRGRRGNTWVSHQKHSLTFSVAYPFNKELSIVNLQGLTLACGASILKSICKKMGVSEESARAQGLGVKWPNDLYFQDRKLGGILVEGGQKSSTGQIWMIIGIGINLAFHDSSNPLLPMASLSELNPSFAINTEDLFKYVCEDLGDMLEHFQINQFVYFQKEWNTWNVWQNKFVHLLKDGETVLSGECLGVNEFGHLQIQTANGLEEVVSGELSLRKVHT